MENFNLSKKELSELKFAHRQARNKREAYRLNVLILLGRGWKVSAICDALLIDGNTVRTYAGKYKSGGIENLLNDDYKPNEGRLGNEERRRLDLHLSEHVYRTVKDIALYVKSEFDEQYTIAGMTQLLHRLGYRYKKPNAIPGKADSEQQAKFEKKYRKIRAKMGKEDSLFFMDGVHPQHNTHIAHGWIKKGEKKRIKTNTRYHRVNINGAIDIDTMETVVSFNAKLNKESTLDFLEQLRKKRPKGWIYLVLDNAGYYNSDDVREYATAMGIVLLFLPPYSPNLNLIERLWKYFKKIALYNRYFETFEAFTKACKDFFKNIRFHKSALTSLLAENFEVIK